MPKHEDRKPDERREVSVGPPVRRHGHKESDGRYERRERIARVLGVGETVTDGMRVALPHSFGGPGYNFKVIHRG